jgi:hypothetical protein
MVALSSRRFVQQSGQRVWPAATSALLSCQAGWQMQYRAESAPPVGPWGEPPPGGDGTLVGLMLRGRLPWTP